MKSWFLALSLGKKFALSAATLLTTMTVAGAALPPVEPAEQVAEPQTVQEAEPQVEVKNLTEKVPIDFKTSEVNDPNLAKGKKSTKFEGKKGELMDPPYFGGGG